jgi:ribosomal protein RSM22 (predicted rRNA methylase)
MHLPPELSEAIERETGNTDRARIAQAVAQLTQKYKIEDFSSPIIQTPAQRAAYLAVRVPATFAANVRVFSEIRRLAQEAEITSILDLGAGPGTALYAATQVFPSLTRATAVEADRTLIELGKRLGAQSSHAAVRETDWLQHDLKSGLRCSPYDLVVLSYSLGELPFIAAQKVLRQAWNAANEFLVIVEPGTTRGSTIVDLARASLIAAGVRILAPCPHSAECPMSIAGDWCHFSQRVERTSTHRQLKGGTLGYEDEKFSYVVAARGACSPAQSRIVRHPLKLSGHVQLALCTHDGRLAGRAIGKSQKEKYKAARKAEWGDSWEQ